MLKKIINIAYRLVNHITLGIFRIKNRNKNPTIISRDCVGGYLYKQLGLRFLSPTINLFLSPEDFISFCLDLREYIEGTFIEDKSSSTDYPVGILFPRANLNLSKPIKIHFVHFKTFDEAIAKWDERKKRINWNNIYVISTFCYSLDTNAFTKELLLKWNNISFHKIILTDKSYGFDDEHIIKKPSKCNERTWMLYAPSKTKQWKKTFNDFDFIRFLNK